MCNKQSLTIFAMLLALAVTSGTATVSSAQTSDRRADEVLSETPVAPTATATPEKEQASINVLELIWAARWLMIPILLMSVVVIAVGIERCLALRRHQIAPPELVSELDSLSATTAFDSSKLIRACTSFPSTLATVTLETMRKLGRPQAEVETMAASVMQRESERLYRNVRTLNLAAAITPLMGLLGTVWGMIAAFFATANLPVGANKAESLAEGIYFALVTTAAGLVVAIPAAMLAHWLEGRIQKSFLDMEELLAQKLLPQTTRLEGRVQLRAAKKTPPTPPAAPSGRTLAAK